MSNKITVYELDFGDTNLIDSNKQVILDWIATDIADMKPGDQLNYTISKKEITENKYDSLPEWS